MSDKNVLSEQRTLLANQRTLFAYIRTGFAAFGVGLRLENKWMKYGGVLIILVGLVQYILLNNQIPEKPLAFNLGSFTTEIWTIVVTAGLLYFLSI